MTPDTETIRTAYVAWARRALISGVGLIALIAAEQIAVRAEFFGAPGGGDTLRLIFWAVAIGGVYMGRNLRARGPVASPDTLAASRTLSWTLVWLSLAPAAVGLVLSFVTRSASDFLGLLVASLIAFAMLFPTYRKWLAWNAPAAPDDEGGPQ